MYIWVLVEVIVELILVQLKEDFYQEPVTGLRSKQVLANTEEDTHSFVALSYFQG
jgi:hypothetical protein